jgi:hypothetical protein
MGIFPPLCKAANILAWSMGRARLIVATSKDGFVWAKAAIAVSARQIVSFLGSPSRWKRQNLLFRMGLQAHTIEQ